MGRMIDFEGHTFFRDRGNDRDLANRMDVQIDLELARFVVGGHGDDPEEIAFYEPSVVRAMRTVADALRRRSYRRRPIQPVPKPARHRCDVCDGTRRITNPYSGEVFRCPVCK